MSNVLQLEASDIEAALPKLKSSSTDNDNQYI